MPDGFSGPNDVWHQHSSNGGLCLNPAGVVVGGEQTSPEECERRGGRKNALKDIWMVHDWVAPGWDCSWGVFAAECPSWAAPSGAARSPRLRAPVSSPEGGSRAITLDPPMAIERRVPEKPSLDGLEDRWAAAWEVDGTYRFDRTKTRDEIFSIDTPPPTASGSLHIGHVFSYTHTDAIARFQRMRGRRDPRGAGGPLRRPRPSRRLAAARRPPRRAQLFPRHAEA